MTSEDWSDCCRTVVVSGVPDVLPNKRMNDKITIHFQSARSCGGDVEEVQYPTHLKGVAFVTFEDWRDAERVAKSEQVLKDQEFDEEYPLTVYKFTPEVTFYAFADVDLSHFPDLSTIIESLRSTHRSVRIEPSLTKEGIVSAEGPFSALRELRSDLFDRARSFRDTQPSRAGKSRQESRSEGAEDLSVWLDTHLYTYIQMLEKKEWDRRVDRHNVKTQQVHRGDVTQVLLLGEPSALTAARAELQELVAEKQRTLRTQHINFSSADPETKTRLLRACESAQNIHEDVCCIPTDSSVAVIGPPLSSHLFCEIVETGHKYE